MAEENKSSWSIFTSITQFFTNDCQCPVSSNGFLSWSRVNGKCEECKSSVHNFITADANFVLYSQFEQTENLYLKKVVPKLLRKDQKKKKEIVHNAPTFKEVTKKLMSIKWKYLSHMYQVSNDIYHCIGHKF